jgi:serine/threonine protein kinase
MVSFQKKHYRRMPARKRGGKKSPKKPKPKRDRSSVHDYDDDEPPPPDFEGYRLGDKLGAGAFGAVYQGLDTTSGGLVAIKIIPLDNSPSALAGVQQEIDLMAGLNHPHIVQYIGSHKTDDTLYIVMEFAEGGSLSDVQKQFGGDAFPEHLVAQYIYQVLQGLAYLHSQSIIHRDIKAANILLNNNVAKLADFGIAVKFDDAQQMSQTFNWSAYWTAPEVISTEPINELCDIWSVGITAIELFVGEPPFYKLAPVTAAFRITQCAQPPLPNPLPCSALICLWVISLGFRLPGFVRRAIGRPFTAAPWILNLRPIPTHLLTRSAILSLLGPANCMTRRQRRV